MSKAHNSHNSLKSLKQRAQLVQDALEKRYPEPETHLYADGAWQLVVAVILSAQCTDARVNMVTPQLFARYPRVEDLAVAHIGDVEEIIRSTGFYRNKAKNIVHSAQRVLDQYAGDVPQSLKELITLPGVARKTANVVLWTAFGINEGIAIDTHVGRIAYRLGLTTHTAPAKVEQDLMSLFARGEWGKLNHRLVWFGRHICQARNPLCDHCEMQLFCPKIPHIRTASSLKSAK